MPSVTNSQFSSLCTHYALYRSCHNRLKEVQKAQNWSVSRRIVQFVIYHLSKSFGCTYGFNPYTNLEELQKIDQSRVQLVEKLQLSSNLDYRVGEAGLSIKASKALPTALLESSKAVSKELLLMKAFKKALITSELSLLDQVLRQGNRKRIQNLVQLGKGPLLLRTAAGKGYQKAAQALIACGVKVNTANKEGKTPLHYACSNGDLKMAELLIDEGADIEARATSMEASPLHDAICSGRQEVVQLLIDAGAKVNGKDAYLRYAVSYGGSKMVALLLQAGASTQTKNSFGDSLMHEAVARKNTDIVKLLIDSKVEVDLPGASGETPLFRACRQGSLAIAQLLVDAGASLSTKSSEKKTPLQVAVVHGKLDVAKLLINRGADCEICCDDFDVQKALADNQEMHQLLIDKGSKEALIIGSYWARTGERKPSYFDPLLAIFNALEFQAEQQTI